MSPNIFENVHVLCGFGDGQCCCKGYAGSKCEKIIGAAEQHLFQLLIQDCDWGLCMEMAPELNTYLGHWETTPGWLHVAVSRLVHREAGLACAPPMMMGGYGEQNA